MIQRGSTETINAAIWYSDLRGFTYLTDRLPSDVLISLLNDHFERVVGPIEANGGEVLKFMGDALLAIFPIDALGSEAQAATAALHALYGALMATADRNLERRQDGQPEMDFGSRCMWVISATAISALPIDWTSPLLGQP
jgi:adenylate cyclase